MNTKQYSSFLMLLLIVQIVFGVMIFMNQDEVKKTLDKVITNLWETRESKMGFWNAVQPAVFIVLYIVICVKFIYFNIQLCWIMFQSTVGMLRPEDTFRLGAEDTGLLLPERHYCVHIR